MRLRKPSYETIQRGAVAVRLSNVSKTYPGEADAVREVSLDVADGEFFAILGPSGSGKTTTLKIIGGFEQPSSGQVWIGGELMGHRPPFQRNVNTVFQTYALFPHLDVRGNVAFGLRMKRVPRGQRGKRVASALAMVQLEHLGHRRVSQLSGGEQQRVALARALVNEPAVLLLDEPLGSLDLKLRKEMQRELKTLQERVGITFVHVTHDQDEALTMADRVAVLRDGELMQVGMPSEIYDNPANRFVAGFVGDVNLLEGVVSRGGDNVVQVDVPGLGSVIGTLGTRNGLISGGAPASVAFRPERAEIALRMNRTAASAGSSNLFEGVVARRIYRGAGQRYEVRLEQGPTVFVDVPRGGDSPVDEITEGAAVEVRWSASAANVLDH